MTWNTLRNAICTAVSAIAVVTYVMQSKVLLGTFIGYWLAVPLALSTVGIFLMSGRPWIRVAWLNSAVVLAAIFGGLYAPRTIDDPDALAFMLFDAGYWMLATTIIFWVAAGIRGRLLAPRANKGTSWP